jgi:hypothetical protein
MRIKEIEFEHFSIFIHCTFVIMKIEQKINVEY